MKPKPKQKLFKTKRLLNLYNFKKMLLVYFKLLNRLIPIMVLLTCLTPSLHAQTMASNNNDLGAKGIAAKNDTTITPPNFFIKGILQQGGFLIGLAPEQTKTILFQHKTLTVNQDRRFFIAFGREADLKQKIIFQLTNGRQLTEYFMLKKSDYDIQRVDGVAPKYVSPSPEQLVRIKKENGMVVALRQTSDINEMAAFGNFIWPAVGVISGIYGSQRIFNGEPRNPHYGVDIALPVGTKIISPAAGRVLLAEDFFLSGKTLIIDHGMGLQSVFMHLDKIMVQVGDTIKQKQPIALSGASGRVSGPHLHWQVNWYDIKFNAQFLPNNQTEAKN